MPYRITTLGSELWKGLISVSYRLRMSSNIMTDNRWRMMNALTDNQKDVLFYLESRLEDGFVDVKDIAYDLKLHPMAVMGIGHSLVKKGLIEKKA